MKRIEEVHQIVKDRLEEAAQRAASFSEMADSARKKAEGHKAEALAAAEACDAKRNHSELVEAQIEEAAARMYVAKAQEIERECVLGEEEEKAYIGEVADLLSRAAYDAKKELIQMATRAKEIAETYEAASKAAQRTFDAIEYDAKRKNKSAVFIPLRDSRVDDEVIWAAYAIYNAVYDGDRGGTMKFTKNFDANNAGTNV